MSSGDGERAGGGSVRVPLRVTWGWMVLAKVRNAVRPSRVALHLAAVGMLSLVLVGPMGRSVVGTAGLVFVALTALRLGVIALSAALDRDARRFDGAVLVFGGDGLVIELPNGTVERRDWSWLLEVRETGVGFELRTAERGGRFWLFLSRDRLGEGGGLRERLVDRGLLAPAG
ncbi:MAG: hypothetical protein R3F61_31630 [Myxococcota bacterium]